jgi:hypothetical protein
MKLEFLKTQRDTPMLLLNGYLYQIWKKNIDDTVRWRCREARRTKKDECKCTAAITTDGDRLKAPRDGNGHYILPEHNHDQVTSNEVAIIRMIDSGNKQVRSSVKVSLKAIINNETHKLF